MARLWLSRVLNRFIRARVFSPRLIGGLAAAPLAAVLLCAALPVQAHEGHAKAVKPEVEAFIKQMQREHGFDADELRKMFAQLTPNQKIIKAFNTPATSKPWNYFRKLYVTPSRIDGGVEFWNEHAELLARARQTYGVPEEIITSTGALAASRQRAQ